MARVGNVIGSLPANGNKEKRTRMQHKIARLGSIIALLTVSAIGQQQARRVICSVVIDGKAESIPFMVMPSQAVNCKQMAVQYHDAIVNYVRQRDYYARYANTYTTTTTTTSTGERVSPEKQKESDKMPEWINLHNGILAVSSIAGLIFFFSCFFTIHTKQAGIVERLGKFERIANAGLNFKVPFIESLVYVEDLNMQLMDVEVVSKTKDDATITLPVRVQYFVLPDKVKEAYYELDDPEDQIKAHVENVILGYIPKIDLDDTYQQENQIALSIKQTLAEAMSRFGYSIENALVTKIVPSDAVINAMNDINAARREKVATEARAESNKIMLVKQAEAEAEAKALAGQGVAREREAIVNGLKKSVLDFEDGVAGVDPHDVMALVMMTQYFDALKDIGANSNTILLPHSPSAVQDLFGQLRAAIISGNLAAQPRSEAASG